MAHTGERLEMAHAAARCGASGKHDGQPLPRPGDGERALSPSRREEHGAEDAEGAERARQAALRHGFYTAERKRNGGLPVLLSSACERLWRASIQPWSDR